MKYGCMMKISAISAQRSGEIFQPLRSRARYAHWQPKNVCITTAAAASLRLAAPILKPGLPLAGIQPPARCPPVGPNHVLLLRPLAVHRAMD
jgi:hypothetical protein